MLMTNLSLTYHWNHDEDQDDVNVKNKKHQRRRALNSATTPTELMSHAYIPLSSLDKSIVQQTLWDIRNKHNRNHSYKVEKEEERAVLLPVPIFVASDDGKVHEAAHKLGYFVSQPEISQRTANDGMLKTLLSHPEFGYNASLEIIRDIWILSRCSTLLGVASSQVFRMAVALSNVTGRLQHVQIMDANQVTRVKSLSRKYHIPFPEQFV